MILHSTFFENLYYYKINTDEVLFKIEGNMHKKRASAFAGASLILATADRSSAELNRKLSAFSGLDAVSKTETSR